MKKLYSLLDISWIYSTVQYLFSIGGKRLKEDILKKTVAELPVVETTLDVGCGPKSLLNDFNFTPVGADISLGYVIQYANHHQVQGVVCSAAELPFANRSFSGIWSRGLFHHLPDDMAKESILEMLRVHQECGYIVIFDAVLPTHPLRRPLAYLIRKLDRGKYMRTQEEFEKMLPNKKDWEIKRYTYNFITKIEILICILKH